MAETGMYSKFIKELWKVFKVRYPFVQKLDKSLGPVIAKSSSFYLGVSPKVGRHIIVHFQASNKPCQLGEFTINVHISEEYAITKNPHPRHEDFEYFGEGFYRFPSAATGKDKWWCLKEKERDATSQSIEFWTPRSWDSDTVVIQEAIDDVCQTLETYLFKKAGYIS